jgi:hypothetical protein
MKITAMPTFICDAYRTNWVFVKVLTDTNSRLLGIHIQTDAAPVITLPSRQSASLEELFDGGEIHVENGTCRIPHEFGRRQARDAGLIAPAPEAAPDLFLV